MFAWQRSVDKERPGYGRASEGVGCGAKRIKEVEESRVSRSEMNIGRALAKSFLKLNML